MKTFILSKSKRDLIIFIGSLRKEILKRYFNASIHFIFVAKSMMDENKEKMNVEVLVKVGDLISTHF